MIQCFHVSIIIIKKDKQRIKVLPIEFDKNFLIAFYNVIVHAEDVYNLTENTILLEQYPSGILGVSFNRDSLEATASTLPTTSLMSYGMQAAGTQIPQ